MLINYARGVIYTTAPSFIVLAGIRAGYNLLKANATKLVSIQGYATRRKCSYD